MGEQRPDDLTGMDAGAGKEYIIRHIAALKETERQYAAAGAELAAWTSRVSLARSKGREDLAALAEAEAAARQARVEQLGAEKRELEAQIETMRRRLPGLAARERSVDPDLLLEELSQAAGYASSEEAETERQFRELDPPTGGHTAR